MTLRLRWIIAALLLGLLVPTAALAQAPTVRAVLFYSPTCPHCEVVINETLPPLFDVYGDRLQIVGIDVTSPNGQTLYLAALEALAVPEDQRGVPKLVLGTTVLTGSRDIPAQLPGLIEAGLAAGGVDWPAIPGLAEALAGVPAAAAPEPTTAPLTVGQRVMQDPAGNTLAIVVLIGMVLSAGAVAARWATRPPVVESRLADWLVPALSALGLLVAIYLTLVELSGDPAVCGPVGDCNAVQQSPYAFLFGILPIGILGVAGYSALILLWAATRLLPERGLHLARLAIFGLTALGTLFSIYLTFLEPFIIGATCAWCLTSAVLMTILLWLTLDPARAAAARLRSA
jgi:uncharacterized membrane protein